MVSTLALSDFAPAVAGAHPKPTMSREDYLHLQDDLQPFARGTRERGRATGLRSAEWSGLGELFGGFRL